MLNVTPKPEVQRKEICQLSSEHDMAESRASPAPSCLLSWHAVRELWRSVTRRSLKCFMAEINLSYLHKPPLGILLPCVCKIQVNPFGNCMRTVMCPQHHPPTHLQSQQLHIQLRING